MRRDGSFPTQAAIRAERVSLPAGSYPAHRFDDSVWLSDSPHGLTVKSQGWHDCDGDSGTPCFGRNQCLEGWAAGARLADGNCTGA
jgi:hypothetical protein